MDVFSCIAVSLAGRSKSEQHLFPQETFISPCMCIILLMRIYRAASLIKILIAVWQTFSFFQKSNETTIKRY